MKSQMLLRSLIAFAIVVLCLLGSCSSQQQAIPATRTSMPGPTIQKVIVQTVIVQTLVPGSTAPPRSPKFVNEVWPAEGSTTRLGDYTRTLSYPGPRGRGVGVQVSVIGVDVEPYDEATWIPARSPLFVDGQMVPADKTPIEDGAMLGLIYDSNSKVIAKVDDGPLWMSWPPKLGPGEHEAKFRLIRNDGKILEYSWRFTLTQD